jgi:hypothetical protein
MASGPVSRILFRTLRCFGRYFSHACEAGRALRSSEERRRVQHTRGYGTGRPATYFALHRTGFFVPSRSRGTRWALTPPFHPCRRRVEGKGRGSRNCSPVPRLRPSPFQRRSVFCDTVRQHALTHAARACREACAASCPVVSGLSSPSFYRARVSPHLGIKERGATTRPRSQPYR